MGEVYRAEDTTLGREVAIKVLPEAVAADPERLARFEREAKVLAALDHPNIAAIYSFEHVDREGDPLDPQAPEPLSPHVHFLVMQLAEGETLAERVKRGALPNEQALPIALSLTRRASSIAT
jgi:serine/threonine protein kinase